MKRTSMKLTAASAAMVLLMAAPAAALQLVPLTSFGGGDGWLDTTESSAVGTGHLERGLTYNPETNHLYVVSRDGGTSVNILDGDTGASVGTLDVTGISGGTFALDMIDVAADGAIYAGNLAVGASTNFKVYRWSNEAAVPTVAYDALTGLARTGDTFAVRGSGAATQIIASGGSGAVDFARLQSGDGLTYTGGAVAATGAPAGAFRLGLDFLSDNTVIGKQTSAADIFDAAIGGGAFNTNIVNSSGEAPLAFDVSNRLLATVDINSSDVRLYDGTDLSVLTTTGFMDMKTNITGASIANPNSTGDLKFGTGPDGGLRLYAMNTNNGIQAFSVVPEPTTVALAALAGIAGLVRRKRS